MKLSHFLALAGLFTCSAASAQTTPDRGTTTSSPSAVPSGSAAAPSNPKGMVSAGDVFTTGAPKAKNNTNSNRSMKIKKDKGMKQDGNSKMKDM